MKIKLLINNNFLISFIYSTSNFPIKIILLFSELYYNQILLSNFVNKSFLLIYNIINRLTIKNNIFSCKKRGKLLRLKKIYFFINASISEISLIIDFDKFSHPFSVTKTSSSILIPIFSSGIYNPGSLEITLPALSGV